MTKGIYLIYDKKMKEFCQAVMLEESEVDSYFTHVASDITSPYFRHESDFDIYRIFFNLGFNENDEFINSLSSYIDKSTRDLQVITQTLNYLPLGFFKMPKEMQEQVQEQIKNSVKDYVENYLADDQRMAINSALSGSELSNG